MQVERQGPRECVLATIAALAGVSLAEVRVVACRAAKAAEWRDVATKERKRDFVRAVRATVRHFNVRGIPAWSRALTELMPRCDCSELPKGRGSIIVQSAGAAHIMPFENGLIYNPSAPTNPVTLKDYLSSHPGWYVAKVTKAKEDSRMLEKVGTAIGLLEHGLRVSLRKAAERRARAPNSYARVYWEGYISAVQELLGINKDYTEP